MPRSRAVQGGVTLITTLIMLLLILMLGIAALQVALQEGRASRNDRDRHIAFQAAEAALLDAESDIEHSFLSENSRSPIFAMDSSEGFPFKDALACNSGEQDLYLGLCRSALGSIQPAWKTIDFLAENAAASHTVPYGRFTGRIFPVGAASLAARLPRYTIELMDDGYVSRLTGGPAYFYRITAIGFGASETTQVILQTFYRKTATASALRLPPSIVNGRLSWREIVNWPELRTAGNGHD